MFKLIIGKGNLLQGMKLYRLTQMVAATIGGGNRGMLKLNATLKTFGCLLRSAKFIIYNPMLLSYSNSSKNDFFS